MMDVFRADGYHSMAAGVIARRHVGVGGRLVLSSKIGQIAEKSQWLRLYILQDELVGYLSLLNRECSDLKGWVALLRATRVVFVTLNNVYDLISELNIDDASFKTVKSQLKDGLLFSKHVRNKGIGHLDKVLSERAVQWMPQLFIVDSRDDFRLAEAERAIIEACINSYIASEVSPKVFDQEIDLCLQANMFFNYIGQLVDKVVCFLSSAITSLDYRIRKIQWGATENWHWRQAFVLAGRTNFNLKRG